MTDKDARNEDTVRLILDAFDNIELRKPLANEIRRILSVNVPQQDIKFERCEQAPKCPCFDKSGRQVCGCYIKHTDRALKKMEAATELRRAKLRAKLGPGVCLECEGDGEQGGQFCGGYWACEACGGTGKDKP